MRAFWWPENQPGWKETAPPVMGQFVRLRERGMPPPVSRMLVFDSKMVFVVEEERESERAYMDRSIACHMGILARLCSCSI